MITRAEVESLLAVCESDTLIPKGGITAELCRAWLAMDAGAAGYAIRFTESGRFATGIISRESAISDSYGRTTPFEVVKIIAIPEATP